MIKCMVRVRPFKLMALKGPFTILMELKQKQRNKNWAETGRWVWLNSQKDFPNQPKQNQSLARLSLLDFTILITFNFLNFLTLKRQNIDFYRLKNMMKNNWILISNWISANKIEIFQPELSFGLNSRGFKNSRNIQFHLGFSAFDFI